jgi:uncharacterized iron-regulated membrane protein
MNKNKDLNRWLWHWHMLAGLITLPIILLLCVTGILYLFKDDYNAYAYQHIVKVEHPDQKKANSNNLSSKVYNPLPYNIQLQAVKAYTDRAIDKVVLPSNTTQATAFILASKGHAKTTVYVNPYTAKVTGEINSKDTGMFLIRKLHGELLLDKTGTYVVELVASWFIVLLLTGLYVFWPDKSQGLSSLVKIKTGQGKRIFYRDLHNVSGFWLSLFMVVIISGGMPWTDIFGSNLKWLQKQTDSGYPKHWRMTKGLNSVADDKALTLDQLVMQAQQYNLSGRITISLAKTTQAVASISNRSLWLNDQQVIHLDQYSGEVIKQYTWQDVGLLMDIRQVSMRLHQGQYGAVTWWAVLLITTLFTVSTAAGLASYLYRKPIGGWGTIRVPKRFVIGKSVLILILGLALLFPLFGGSLLLLSIMNILRNVKNNNKNAIEKLN